MNKCSITSSIIAIALCGCSSPIHSGDGEPVITGISANIHLLYNGEEKQCPYEEQDGQTISFCVSLLRL